MKNKIFIGAGSILAVLTLAVVLSNTVEAYKGNPSIKGPNYSAERHTAMTKAFETNDFDAWKKLMTGNNGKVTQLVNKDNFAKFAEAHRLALKGDLAGSQKIKLELGLGSGNGNGNHGGRGVGGRGNCLK